MAQPQVLLLKAADASYAAALERRALAAHFADVLAFDFVNAAALHDAVTHLERFSALLVTSPRAASAVANALLALRDRGDDSASNEHFECALRTLRALPVYAVGRATSRELEALGVACRGVECGSAEALAALVHREDELPPADADARPVLFACGEKRSDVLPESFRARGRPLLELEVYRSRKLESVELPPGLVPHWVAFFSPSGLSAILQQTQLPWADIRKAAIGNTTAAAMRAHAEATGLSHWVADVVAPQPTADGLADAIAGFEEGSKASSPSGGL